MSVHPFFYNFDLSFSELESTMSFWTEAMASIREYRKVLESVVAVDLKAVVMGQKGNVSFLIAAPWSLSDD